MDLGPSLMLAATWRIHSLVGVNSNRKLIGLMAALIKKRKANENPPGGLSASQIEASGRAAKGLSSVSPTRN